MDAGHPAPQLFSFGLVAGCPFRLKVSHFERSGISNQRAQFLKVNPSRKGCFKPPGFREPIRGYSGYI